MSGRKFEVTIKVNYNYLERYGDLIKQEAWQITVEHANHIANWARAFSPINSGELHDSITTDLGSDGQFAYSVARAPYAAVIEFGDHNQVAQPFMGKAAEIVWPVYVDAMKALLADLK